MQTNSQITSHKIGFVSIMTKWMSINKSPDKRSGPFFYLDFFFIKHFYYYNYFITIIKTRQKTQDSFHQIIQKLLVWCDVLGANLILISSSFLYI